MPLNVQLVNAQVKDPQSGQMTPAGLIGSDALSTINQAKNQAIAAVQQKGEETLQSIPDDYTALSNEVADVKTQLFASTKNKAIEMTEGAYYALNGTSVTIGSPSSHTNEKCALVPCSPGDVFTVSGTGGATARPWGFAKSNGDIIITSGNTSGTPLTLENAVITAPANAAYLIINNQISSNGVSYYGELIAEKVDRENNKIYEYLGIIQIKGNQIPRKVKEKFDGKYFVKSGDVIITGNNANYDAYIIPITDATSTIYYKTSSYTFVTAADGTILAGANDTPSSSVDLSGLSNPAYLYYSHSKNSAGDVYVSYGSIITEQINTLDGQEPCSFDSLTGKLTADMVDGFSWGNLKGKMVFDTAGYRYASDADKSPYVGSTANMSTYILDIENAVYTFNKSIGFLTPIKANGKSVVASIENATTYDNTSGTAVQLYVSLQNSYYNDLIVSKGTFPTTENTYPEWLEKLKYEPNRVKYFDKYTGDYSEQIKLQNIKSSISSNVEYSFSGDVSGWGSESSIKLLLLDANNTEQISIEVNNTNLVVTSRNYGTPASNTYTHGLTIANNLQIHVENTYNNQFKIAVTSNGITFVKEAQLVKQGKTYPSITATSVTVTNVSFSWISRDINKPIWCFGDSYFGATSNTRWLYYLVDGGYYGAHLFDNYPGEDSNNAYASLIDLLKVARPRTIFWALGMNDGSDSSTPASAWKTNIDKITAMCEAYDIELVLATIPTVPTVNNEKKNEWVRESGYQYVDFAKAVGAQSDGTWYSGMLSPDEVHPSATGANALYNRAIADFPAIMLK